MSAFKLGLFIIVAGFFLFVVYLYIEERDMASGHIGGLVRLILVTLIIVSGVVTLTILIYAPRLYLHVFLGMIALGVLGLFIQHFMEEAADTKKWHRVAVDNEANAILDEAWEMIEASDLAFKKASKVTVLTGEIERNKIGVLLGIYLKNDAYKTIFEEAMDKAPKVGFSVVSYVLEHYEVSTQREYLILFDVLLKYGNGHRGLDSIVSYKKEHLLSFEYLLSKSYMDAALLRLKLSDINQHNIEAYLENAFSVEDDKYRQKAIITILKVSPIYYQEWNNQYTMTTASLVFTLLKEAKFLEEYVTVLEHKLERSLLKSEKNSTAWEYYINQESQESFMLMYNELGKEHQYIKMIPLHITAYYLSEEEKILKHGKENFILYRNYIGQIEADINHQHAYTSEPYSIYVDNKLVHQSLTNEHGCVQYKYYGAKSTDRIELKTYVGIEGQQAVAWMSELSPWNSEKGLFQRMAALGFIYSKHEGKKGYIRRLQSKYNLEVTEKYNDETGKKADELLSLFTDEKWCQ